MDSIINAILGAIGTVLYGLFNILFVLIDALYGLFKSFAGVGDMAYAGETITGANGGGLTDTGIVYYLLQTDLVKNMFLSILLLGLFLLIIFSVMAFIKNAYSAKPKTWQEIIGNAFRGLANFVVVPVACLLGIWAGNILLKAIDGATSNGSNLSLAGRLFVSSAYNANKIRAGDKEVSDSLITILVDADNNYGDKFDFDESMKGDREYVASKVDELFSSGLEERMSYGNVFEVGNYYNTFDINYLIIIVGGLFMSYVMLTLTYAMIRRLFIIIILFIISPAVNSYYPLDEGKAAGSWKSDFVKQVTSAYGAIAGMNLFFSILPLVRNIQLTGSWAMSLLNLMGITELIITICGLLIVNEFISMISNYFGLENAYDKGASMRSKVKGIQKKAAGVTKGVVGAFAKAAGAHAGGGSFLKSIGGSLWGATGGKALEGMGIDVGGIKKTYKESKDETIKREGEKAGEFKAQNEYKGKKIYVDADGNRVKASDSGAIETTVEEQFKKMKSASKGKALSEGDIAKLLSYVEGNKGLTNLVAGNISDYNNNAITRRSRLGIHGHKTATAEKVIEDNESYKTGEKRAQERDQAYTGYINVQDQRAEAKSKLQDFVTNNATLSVGKLLFDGDGNITNRYSSNEINRLKAEWEAKKGTPEELAAKRRYENAVAVSDNAEKYDRLKATADAFDSKMQHAAEVLQQAMQAVADSHKGAIKDAYSEASDTLKQALTENQNDVGAVMTKVESVITSLNTSINALSADDKKRKAGTEITRPGP